MSPKMRPDIRAPAFIGETVQKDWQFAVERALIQLVAVFFFMDRDGHAIASHRTLVKSCWRRNGGVPPA